MRDAAGLMSAGNLPHSASSSGFLRVSGDEQRRRSVYRSEAGVRPVFQPLVRREVPEGGSQRRPVHRELPEVPALRAEGHQGEGHPDRRGGIHGPQQRQTRELMTPVFISRIDPSRPGKHVQKAAEPELIDVGSDLRCLDTDGSIPELNDLYHGTE